MDTKKIPALITLTAATITLIVSLLQGVSFSTFTLRFVCTVAVFLFLGSVIKIVVDYSFKVMEEGDPEIEDSEVTDENLENIDSDENITDDDSKKDEEEE